MKNYTQFFINSIRGKYPGSYKSIIQRVQNHYKEISTDTAFARTSRNPIDRRLDFCAYFLALIKTLHENGESFESIRATCLEIVIAYVQPSGKIQAAIKKWIPKLIGTWPGRRLIQIFHNRISVNENKEGFKANIITDKTSTYGLGYGIDIIECGICKLFKKHDYFGYASILCEVDEITSGLAGLTLIRTGTIANGAHTCDFRFKKE